MIDHTHQRQSPPLPKLPISAPIHPQQHGRDEAAAAARIQAGVYEVAAARSVDRDLVVALEGVSVLFYDFVGVEDGVGGGKHTVLKKRALIHRALAHQAHRVQLMAHFINLHGIQLQGWHY